jgi:hypothetical protein
MTRDCTQLPTRQRAYCEGTSGLPRWQELYLLDYWDAHRAGQPLPAAPVLPPANAARSRCIHLGAETGERKVCGGCTGHVEIKALACARHNSCTVAKPLAGVACCATCPDWTPPITADFADGTVRNLLYHIYPRRGEVWRWNVGMLRKRLSLFNGRRIVSIVYGPETEFPEAVHCELAGEVEFVEQPNNPDLREVQSFLPLWEAVASTDPREVTFFGHAKGVTSSDWCPGPARLWAEAMYELCLDYWPEVERMLQHFPVVGPFKRTVAGWPAHESRSNWHFSGSFHWFRNRDLFLQPDWRRIDLFHSGIESYPSLHFSHSQAGCLFHEFASPGENYLYRADRWAAILPLFAAWKAAHVADRTLRAVLPAHSS